MSTFTCAHCGNIIEYDEEWTEEDASDELYKNFGEVSTNNCDIVCDNCYKKTLKGGD